MIAWVNTMQCACRMVRTHLSAHQALDRIALPEEYFSTLGGWGKVDSSSNQTADANESGRDSS